MRRTTRAFVFCALTLTGVGCGKVFEYPEPEPERGAEACHDGVDNDFDGSADCDDQDCTGVCNEGSEAECSDGLDNDGDGQSDADDARCWHLHPPEARRCGEHAGVNMIENFDLPAWAKVYSSWRRWGVSGRGLVVDSAPHEGTERHDPLVAFAGNTTDADELTSNLGALVWQAPFAGNWQDFELSFGASVPPGALLRAALVPVDLAPSQDTPLARTDTARIALTLDAVHDPPTLTLDFEGQHFPEEPLALDSLCGGTPCEPELLSVKIALGPGGFEARLAFPNGEETVISAPSGPSSAALPPSRLVFWGGSVSPDAALLDDVRLKLRPDWPCGFSAPQIPGAHCGVGESLGRFGQSVSVARSADGEYCALVAAGRSAGKTEGALESSGIPAPTSVTAWRSSDGVSWTPNATLEPGGSVVGAAIARGRDGWLAALSYRDGGMVRLGLAEGASCDAWSGLSPGPTLFADAEAPSYVALEGRYQVLFTRPPNDETKRTLWRIAPDEPNAVPELVAKLPPGVSAPVSITRVGESDLVLAYPSPASAQSAGGVGLLVGSRDLSTWEPINATPVLELPPGIDLFGGHGRVAFDDRGIFSATLAWDESARFLLYAGRATGGFPASPFEAPELVVGTAELLRAGDSFEAAHVVPPPSCGDGICGPTEQCSSCEADCPCGGPRILGDVLGPGAPWQMLSLDPAPEAIRYFDADPPGLGWASGEPTWSVLPLEHAVTGDFELSFDAFVGYRDQFDGGCVLNVGLGTVPNLDGPHPASAGTGRAGIFARVLTGTGWFYALPLVLTEEAALGEGVVAFQNDASHFDEFVSMDHWWHVVLRREGETIRAVIPALDGCGVVEQTVTYAGPLGELPALLVGFGGSGLDGCPADLVQGTGGHGTIRNLELRLLDDPDRCPEGKERCGSDSEEPTCVDRATSADHCGACGRHCVTKQICIAGQCVCNSEPGVIACDGDCVDSSTSNDHCGACGNRCTSGLTCVGARCVVHGDCMNPFVMDPSGGTITLGTSLVMPPHTTLCTRDVQDEVVLAWTPVETGIAVVDIDVGETHLDTLLGVTADPTCDAWFFCNDDKAPPADLGSVLEFPVEAGVTYFIGAGVLWDHVPGETAELSVAVVP